MNTVYLSICLCPLRRISYLFLLFFGILDSVGYIFSFLPCLLLLFFTIISVHLISPTNFTPPVFRMRKMGFVNLWIFSPSFKICKVKVEHQEEKFNSFSLLTGDTVGTRQWTLGLVFSFLGFSCFHHSSEEEYASWWSLAQLSQVWAGVGRYQSSRLMAMGRSTPLLQIWKSNPASWGILPSLNFVFFFCKMETIGSPTLDFVLKDWWTDMHIYLPIAQWAK